MLRRIAVAVAVALAACPIARAEPSSDAAPALADDPAAAAAAAAAAAGPPVPPAWPALELLGQTIEPGTSRALDFRSRDDFSSYLVAFRGVAPGPTLCVTAGVHGDELNGVAIARQLVDATEPQLLRGTLIVSPIVNAHGYRSGSRYLPDRRDLNRYFPGRPYGSIASRIAHQLFEQVVRRCEALVDLHTGSLNRTNVAQIRTDLREVANLRLAWGFGAEHVVHSVGQPGTLRRAANDAGIPAVLYEAGEPRRIDAGEIARGVVAIRVLLESLGMLDGQTPRPEQRLYGHTHWIRSDESGMYVPAVEVGDTVAIGQTIGTITDPFSSDRTAVLAPLPGRVLGMALGQVVIPGFALFHLGLEAPSVGAGYEDDELARDDDAGPEPADPLRAELLDERPE
ncbi:MAG: peptidase M14 [Proteobacteria bacterium]|nr:MAG: peptidase M14 [Pseudomonadota bacterium]